MESPEHAGHSRLSLTFSPLEASHILKNFISHYLNFNDVGVSPSGDLLVVDVV
jgi:hypothetical protein